MGTQVDSSSLVSNPGVNGLLWAGYPGQDGGTAIINIITGKTAPAGRLPVTQYPVSKPYNLLHRLTIKGRICERCSNDGYELTSRQRQPWVSLP